MRFRLLMPEYAQNFLYEIIVINILEISFLYLHEIVIVHKSSY